MKLVWGKFGLAYRYGDTIEINEIFKENPKLLKHVMEHEMNHSSGTGIDFMHDLKDSIKYTFNKDWFLFFLKHPKAYFQSAMPVWYDHELNVNWFLVVFYLASFAVLFSLGVFYFG